MSEWKPIGTAPKDEDFLVYIPAYTDPEDGWVTDSFVEVCGRWNDGSIVGCRTHSEYNEATHWMPLPAPPKESGNV